MMALAGLATILAVTLSALADRIEMRDGTVIEGTAIAQGERYWIKTPDGKSRMVPAADVKSVTKEPAESSGGEPGPTRTADSGNSAQTFNQAKSKADSVDQPIAAVAIWQAFIDHASDAAAIDAAKKELIRWQVLARDGAEKINGKWVGGEERKAILKKATEAAREGWELMGRNQTLQAVKKLEEAAKIYPNSYEINTLLGYVSTIQQKKEDALKYFELAARQAPKSPEALSNLGVALFEKKQFERGILSIYKAVEISDSMPLAQNLINAMTWMPESLRKNARMKPAVDAAKLLATKYGIRGPTRNWNIMPPVPQKDDADDRGGRPGAMWSGTGFLISADGLILTNRHVAADAGQLMVVMDDGTQKSAEVVVLDDEQDLALIRIKPDAGKKLPFLQLASADVPNDGADCVVMGYPLADRLGTSVKVTKGIVTSIAKGKMPDVIVDAKVNPGNSGGPMLDKNGNVMAVVSMKTIVTAREDSYGMGISPGQVRVFLKKNKLDLAAGDAAGAVLNPEQIAAKVRPAVVCILATAGN